jgi:hypothetical protein
MAVGRPADEIVAYARDQGVGLIVIGGRGREGTRLFCPATEGAGQDQERIEQDFVDGEGHLHRRRTGDNVGTAVRGSYRRARG